VPEGEYVIPIGVADIKRTGSDVTIVSFGKIIKEAYKAADELAKENISAEVIDLRSIRPIDYATIVESVKKTNRLVVVEEAWPLGNISTEIAYHIQKNAFDYLDAPVRRVNSEDVPLSYAGTLVEPALPNMKKVISAVKEVMYL
jgi:pyruvate dehydrogenase E1 component beta subunit